MEECSVIWAIDHMVKDSASVVLMVNCEVRGDLGRGPSATDWGQRSGTSASFLDFSVELYTAKEPSSS